MKKHIVTLIAILTISIANAQEWKTNFIEAKATASKENKPIVMVFQGSDWCFPCMKLERNIWSKDTFKNYAKENYVLLKVDFPTKSNNILSKQQQKHNGKLAERYNKEGYFPLVVVLDKNGKVLGKTGYKKATPKEYITELNKIIN